jgi:hypothetical protein
MRQMRIAGECMFVDYAGTTIAMCSTGRSARYVAGDVSGRQ